MNSSPNDVDNALLASLPRLICAGEDLLVHSIHGLSMRAGQLLWIIDSCNHSDGEGEGYLDTGDLVFKFQKWLFLSRKTAQTAVSNAKKELFKHKLIKQEKGPSRVYRTAAGKRYTQQMKRRAKKRLAAVLGALGEEELQVVLRSVSKVIESLPPPRQRPEKSAVSTQASEIPRTGGVGES